VSFDSSKYSANHRDSSAIHITPDLINNIIMPHGYLSVPLSITEAISKCIQSTDLAQIEEAKIYYKEYFSKRGRERRPLNDVEYVGTGKIDAYSIHYLPRNTFIPGFAFSCLSYHPNFQTLPRRIRVLDLGSGTGAITLGLLHLCKCLGSDIDLLCLDKSGDALTRQSKHIKLMEKRPRSFNLKIVDFANKGSYEHLIEEYGPYDMIFAANVFSEMLWESALELMTTASNYMADAGVFVYCDASGRYNRDQFPVVLKKAASIGLHTYYPCQPCIGPNTNCGYWRTDSFVCPDMDILGNKINIANDGSNINKTYMALLCKNNINIFSYLTNAYPEIHWGLLKRNLDKASYSCCTSHGTIRIVPDKSEVTVIQLRLRALMGKGIFAGVGAKSGKIEYVWDFLKGVIKL